MARKARVNFFARTSLPKRLNALKSTPRSDWPAPLVCAWQILTDELHLSDQDALSVILESVEASHNCIRSQNQQLRDLNEVRVRGKIQKACNRVARCIKRAPAVVRRRLNQCILPLIDHTIIDLEIIETILKTAANCFDEFPADKSSCLALKALREPLPGNNYTSGSSDFLPAAYSALSPRFHREVELSLVSLARPVNAGLRTTAADIFEILARALNDESVPKINDHARDVVTSFVAELARSWRRVRLKPSKALSYLNDAYRSKFHRFAELIYMSMSPPRGNDVICPADIDAELKRKDYEWRVSDDYLKRATGSNFDQKTP